MDLFLWTIAIYCASVAAYKFVIYRMKECKHWHHQQGLRKLD